ncbi:EAL domain-containing protein [Clostridium sp.]|uniref:bifunctional diguanylate cyclase/phosphodiesterase n=1 Tax=Clostridium sp. TaxID=1506 RepID=UPI001A5A3604|nr:EAL domain-containing protein [Clostridium sp.]MBK5241074.1 EAL domain-containing protein [Clostridium sp.]
MKITFRWKLFLYFVVVVLFTTITIAVITHKHIYTTLKNDMYSDTERQMEQVDNTFSNMFKQIKDNNSYLSSSEEIKKADESILALFNMSKNESAKKYSKQIPGIESNIYKKFENYGATHSDAEYVYLGTKWGGFIRWPDGPDVTSYDPRVRPWYTGALAKPDEVVISEPYISSDENKSLIISASSTIKDEYGSVIGVMGLDVSLEKLSNIISNIKMRDTGYAFLFSKDGTILAHPNSNLNFKNIEYAIKDYDKILTESNAVFETVIDGSEVLVNVYSSPTTGWKIAAVVPKSELISWVNKTDVYIAIVTFVVLLVSIFLTSIMTKHITKPITQLTSLMREVENGDYEVRAKDIHTNDEFGELGARFNVMIKRISSTYEELSAVHEELTATEEELRAQYEELQHNEEALTISDERYQLALDGSNDAIWEFDIKLDVFFASDKIFEITGYKPTENFSTKAFIKNFVHLEDRVAVLNDLKKHINNITPIYKSEFRIKINDGTYIWVSNRGKAIRDSDGKAVKIAGSITDITDRKNAEEKIKFMAYYDDLTKLPNRTFFMDKLKEQLKTAKLQNSKGAVFFIDLDNFKNINDTMGHDYGDKLLVFLAKKMEILINEKDTICRLGGDEFILLHPCNEKDEVESYAKALLALFNRSFEIDNKQMYITASIGVALYPKDGNDTSTILKNADSAMYKAKELGKNQFARFDEEMYLKLERKTCIDRILRNAIENNELSIHYQPQFDTKTNEIFGFEALLRLNSVELGFVSPVEFIPIAEESGYIMQMDRWVLNEACRKSVEWLHAGYKFKSISINVSTVDMHQIDFLETVKGVFENTGINPNIVELEITETVLMESLEANVKILKELMNMGVRVALDDFGTGYSSLNYLMKIPISTLKIDKSFIDDITSNIQNKSLIENIIRMAHGMDLKVVAEGVETEHQLSILKENECDYIQGYYYSKPLSVMDAEKLLLKSC